MQGISTSINGPQLTVDFSEAKLDLSSLGERIEEILPLLYALLAADTALSTLNGDEVETRGRGFLAIDAMCQVAIWNAQEKAELLREIAKGEASIANHGFPEFAEGRSVDV